VVGEAQFDGIGRAEGGTDFAQHAAVFIQIDFQTVFIGFHPERPPWAQQLADIAMDAAPPIDLEPQRTLIKPYPEVDSFAGFALLHARRHSRSVHSVQPIRPVHLVRPVQRPCPRSLMVTHPLPEIKIQVKTSAHLDKRPEAAHLQHDRASVKRYAGTTAFVVRPSGRRMRLAPVPRR